MKPRTDARDPSRLLDVELYVTLDGGACGRGPPAYFGHGGPDFMAPMKEPLAASTGW